MNQYSAIREVRKLLRQVIDREEKPELVAQLKEIDNKLEAFHDRGIDFKEVVDGLDDSIFITDAEGVVLYINPAYTRNTGITEEDVLHKSIYSLIGEDKLFTGGAITSVLEGKKSAFRLSTTYKTETPVVGYVMGTPLFKPDGSLRQVVAISRPIITLGSLQEDFDAFVKEVNSLHPKTITKDSDKHLSGSMVGKYGSLQSINTLIDWVAPTDASILITGESGVGKEVVADEIYRRSLRKDKPYVKINCASIPGHLLESELFGYEKGAFTGASAKGKIGLFEYANHGTLMLDEIGDMPMDLQVKLLRAIQSQEITRIGGTRPIKLDIRFVALTNADLKKKVAEGTFRQDLYYRLNVIPVSVPALRERLEDFEELCDYFIQRFTEKYNRSFRLTQWQTDYMKRYSWPGNIRELENVMEYLILCSSGIGHIEDDVLRGLLNVQEESIPSVSVPVSPPPVPEPEEEPLPEGVDFNQAVSGFEKRLLERVLKESSNLRDASKKLNINASTICRKIKQYGIDYENRRS
ncbi:sigma-54 interaction domain-containing protein [Pseudoflavonifractor phocaeensis]|uniref:sigma-54 interaction domain-containing protein n=1 Tax=Pseudoflavonifractor phocaeensis TaxID=1870988 RepID=UPI00195C3C99|nr:sigma 54-interacting transcriptional regulator [Pseudoflavonifractor phocaeensis]MBM6926994.1 sigma 54-interacting transcriptional regulator [Pseudoflavonifractor phocaeensis]